MKLIILIWCKECEDFIEGTCLNDGRIICSKHNSTIGKLLVQDECNPMEKV